MRLYVPSLRDKLLLTSDWSFSLFQEYRNDSLWALMHCDDRAQRVDASELPSLVAEIDAIRSRQVKCTEYGWTRMRWASRADETRYYELANKVDRLKNDRFADVTIPAGSTLTVDRIYIRKGADDFSSITFYADIPGLTKPPKSKSKVGLAGRTRFWAKLYDCNNIEFERVEDDQ